MTGPPRGRFATTRWSVVLAARSEDSGLARTALATLCETYWPPVFAFVRRHGRTDDDARDLTQAFFTRVIEKGDFTRADPARGRFRTFLLTSVSHFLANQFHAGAALKRGGGVAHVPMEPGTTDRPAAAFEPRDDDTPERIYERRWALTVLDTALQQLGRHYDDAGQRPLFEALKPLITGDHSTLPPTLAADLDMSDGALRVALHRLRKRFSKALREVVAETVDDPAAVEDELRHLMAAVSR